MAFVLLLDWLRIVFDFNLKEIQKSMVVIPI